METSNTEEKRDLTYYLSKDQSDKDHPYNYCLRAQTRPGIIDRYKSNDLSEVMNELVQCAPKDRTIGITIQENNENYLTTHERRLLETICTLHNKIVKAARALR